MLFIGCSRNDMSMRGGLELVTSSDGVGGRFVGGGCRVAELCETHGEVFMRVGKCVVGIFVEIFRISWSRE